MGEKLMMEAVSTSETSVTVYQTTRGNIPEDSRLHRLRVFKNKVLRRICGPKKEEVTEGWRKLHNEELVICTLH
jgi:hypothetical protein